MLRPRFLSWLFPGYWSLVNVRMATPASPTLLLSANLQQHLLPTLPRLTDHFPAFSLMPYTLSRLSPPEQVRLPHLKPPDDPLLPGHLSLQFQRDHHLLQLQGQVF
jgi:hypothetical protein